MKHVVLNTLTKRLTVYVDPKTREIKRLELPTADDAQAAAERLTARTGVAHFARTLEA